MECVRAFVFGAVSTLVEAKRAGECNAEADALPGHFRRAGPPA